MIVGPFYIIRNFIQYFGNLLKYRLKESLIRKLAVTGYSKELKQMINDLSKHSVEQITNILIIAVWFRAMLNIEGKLPVIENEDGELNPELSSYPILLKGIEKWISIFNKKGFQARSFCFSIWVHTLRSIIRPELSDMAGRMWDILMRSKPNWESVLTQFRGESIKHGISHDVALSTERHAKAILQCLPPKQLSYDFNLFSVQGTSERDDWKEKILCGDGSCIGVIGPDGRCNKCGKSFGEGKKMDEEKTKLRENELKQSQQKTITIYCA